jgi:hypothetical protein
MREVGIIIGVFFGFLVTGCVSLYKMIEECNCFSRNSYSEPGGPRSGYA